MVKSIAKDHMFYMGFLVKSYEIFLLLNIRTMVTNFSPC